LAPGSVGRTSLPVRYVAPVILAAPIRIAPTEQLPVQRTQLSSRVSLHGSARGAWPARARIDPRR